MSEHLKLPEGVKLVKTDTFWPDGSWYFLRDLAVPLGWNNRDGRIRYYFAHRIGCHFQTSEDAMKAWEEAHPEPATSGQ